MKLYRTPHGPVVEDRGRFVAIDEPWDAIVNRPQLGTLLAGAIESGRAAADPGADVLAPVVSQEVWAAGVTYFRSRSARMEESESAGGGGFYDRVYGAPRPELFFKAAPWRVRGPGEAVRVRRDSTWSVPEPELALYLNARGEIVGYTVGNDMSARDIEGENPLYLPQAKVYDGACALGPAVLVADAPLPGDTAIELRISRAGAVAIESATTLSQMRRTPVELAEYLYRETSFPDGCVLLTGTGIVPPDDFTLQPGDEIAITIPPIGTLVNPVA